MKKYKPKTLDGFPYITDFNIKVGDDIDTHKYVMSGYVYKTFDTKRLLVEYIKEDDLIIAPVKGTA